MIRTVKITVGVTVFALAILFLAHTQSPPLTNRSVQLTGINLAGAEFGSENLPGIYGQHYIYPDPSTIDYFAAKGMNIIRLPLSWERLQHELGSDLDEAEMRRIDLIVNYTGAKKIKIILDVHNYAAYFGSVIGTEKLPPNALGDLWRRIGARYKDNELVIFGLMNEPTGLQTKTWLTAANSAIAEIRRTGAKNLIFVPGNGWSSARSWTGGGYGTSNAKVMLNVVDAGNNSVFEVHQYFNSDWTGTRPDCQSDDIGVLTLTPFTQWARKHRKRGFLGEFGVGSNPTCLEALDRVLKFMAENNDVWLGWTYWAAGSWWPKDYFTSIEPLDGRDRPQMSVLEKYIRPQSLR
jgi:endoglucanase